MKRKPRKAARNPRQLAPLDVAQRYSVDEACGYLRVSRAYLYKLIGTGEVPTIADGRRKFVPGTAIAERSRVAA